MREEEVEQSSTTTPPPNILKKLADQVNQILFLRYLEAFFEKMS